MSQEWIYAHYVLVQFDWSAITQHFQHGKRSLSLQNYHMESNQNTY
jgi:hypothetical protein